MAWFNFLGVFSICLLFSVTNFKGDASNIDQDRKASLILIFD